VRILNKVFQANYDHYLRISRTSKNLKTAISKKTITSNIRVARNISNYITSKMSYIKFI